MKKIEIFTDGACRGNPGLGGWGALIRKNGQESSLWGGEKNTTNNRMEMEAAIRGLESIEESSNITLTTDSNYLKDGITKWLEGWKKKDWKTAAKKPVKNKDLWMRLDALSQFHTINWRWVKGHSGHRENEIADMLKASYSHAQQDRDARMLAEQKVEAIGLVEAVKAALLLDADLLDKQQLAKINNGIDTLLSDIDTDDTAIITQSVASLGRETEAFAALRMDQSIRKALQGKNLDDVVE